jgi:hypothetical protein
MSRRGDVIIEFVQVGAYVKVSAVDPATFTEVSIVGDPRRGEEALKRAAIGKLDYVLERNLKTARGRA